MKETEKNSKPRILESVFILSIVFYIQITMLLALLVVFPYALILMFLFALVFISKRARTIHNAFFFVSLWLMWVGVVGILFSSVYLALGLGTSLNWGDVFATWLLWYSWVITAFSVFPVLYFMVKIILRPDKERSENQSVHKSVETPEHTIEQTVSMENTAQNNPEKADASYQEKRSAVVILIVSLVCFVFFLGGLIAASCAGVTFWEVFWLVVAAIGLILNYILAVLVPILGCKAFRHYYES